mgnify:CR=1 FL=1
MQYNDLLVYEPGNQYPAAPSEVAPFATIPAWWRGFIFRVLNAREFAVYMFIAMRTDGGHAVAYPLASDIQEAMGLSSDSAIFDSLRTLDELGFIRRRAQQLPNRSSRLRRNIYQRAAPEFTLLQLLNRTAASGRRGDAGIDEFLQFCRCPAPRPAVPDVVSAIPRDVAAGLKRFLQDYDSYAFANDGDKREALKMALEEQLARRMQQGGERYQNRQPAPRDRQRQEARARETAIAAAGGVSILDDEIPF